MLFDSILMTVSVFTQLVTQSVTQLASKGCAWPSRGVIGLYGGMIGRPGSVIRPLWCMIGRFRGVIGHPGLVIGCPGV